MALHTALSTALFCLLIGLEVDAAVAKTKSQQKCKEYAQAVYQWEDPVVLLPGAKKELKDTCGYVERPLVVGGLRASPREFPHMALIGYGSPEKVSWLCGGSLISDRYILSAAHCAHNNDPQKSEARWALMGDLKLFDEEDEAGPVTVEIVERKVHPQYDPDLVYNDVALFRLATPINFTAYVRPACLHSQTAIPRDHPYATGWGQTRHQGFATTQLMKVQLPLVGTPSCNQAYKGKSKVPRGILEASMVCAGGDLGKDTCQGDSGGPLQIPQDDPYCTFSVVGVTSFGAECGVGKPAVYTRVSHYRSWIESIVWP